MPIHDSVGWMAEDFIDPPAQNLMEEDPWDVPVLAESQELTAFDELEMEGEPASVTSALDRKQPHSRFTFDTADLDSDDIALDPPLGLEAEISLLDSEPPDDWFVYDTEPDLDSILLDEPVPTAEFNPELSEDLYGAVNEINLTEVNIRLDQFLAQLSLSDDQASIIRAHLETFSQSRLISWLPWLNSKEWTPRLLTSFVRFHRHWETMPEWWESWWHDWRCGWNINTSSAPNILSRDAAYEIVRYRINYSPHDMVVGLWFEEWDCYSMWRYGFESFAKFAMFRAAISPDDDWRSWVDWADSDDDIELDKAKSYNELAIQQYTDGKIPLWEDQLVRVSSLPHWFAIQDWYPRDEWHDNLG